MHPVSTGSINGSCLFYRLSLDCLVLMTVTKRRASHHPKHTFSISKWDNLGRFISLDGAFVLSPSTLMFLSPLGGYYFHHRSPAVEPPPPTLMEEPGSLQGCLGNTCEQNSPSYWAPAANPPSNPTQNRSWAGGGGVRGEPGRLQLRC